MEYKRVSDRLAGYWDKPWSELPNEQRQAWREVTSFTDTDSVVELCQPTELILWDDLDPQGRQIAASCHDAQHDPADEQERSMAFQGGFKETAYNGQAIKWRYWTSFRTLTAYQFSCLVSALDPDVVDAGHTRLAATKALQNAKDIERLAYNHGKVEASACEWLKWADEQGFNVFSRFRLAVGEATVARDATAFNAEFTAESQDIATPPQQLELDTTGMVAWQAAMLESWGAIVKQYGRQPTARQVLFWLRKNGPRDVFPGNDTGRNSLTWIVDGNTHTVAIQTISNVISKFKKMGLIPAC